MTHRITDITKTFALTDRRILITGAAGGIGSATARLCAAQGARLVLADIAGEACDPRQGRRRGGAG